MKTFTDSKILQGLATAIWSPSSETSSLLNRYQINHRFEGRKLVTNDASETCHHVKQVHGNRIVAASSATAPNSNSRIEADGIMTTNSEKISVKTADCLPVLIAATDKSVVAAVHAGWRGFTQGIIIECLKQLQTQTKNENLIFAIGPAISREAFEVGPEVVEALQKVSCGLLTENAWQLVVAKGKNDRWHVDLQTAAALQLLLAGIHPKQIEVIQACTVSEQEHGNYSWNSYRRDGRVVASNWSWIRL